MIRRKIIIDCDPGVDDAAAILLALASPEIDVIGLTVVAGNVPLAATSANARRITALAGRSDLPVHAGCPGPLARAQIFGKYAHIGAFGDDLVPPAAAPPADGHAVTFLSETASAAARSGERVTLCCTAPMTNVALALRQDEQVVAGIERIVMMGGAFAALGNRVPWAEFNMLADPHAAEIVFTSGVPVTMLPLDVTFQALLTETHLDEMRARGGPPGRALASLIGAHDRSDVGRLGRPGAPLHDAMTIAWLLRPELFHGRPAAIGCVCEGVAIGHTYADFYGKSARAVNADVMHSVDEDGFVSLLIERLEHFDDRTA